MSLDMFQDDATAAYADASRNIAPDVPAEFSESLNADWRYMTDWHSTVAYQASKAEALAQMGDDIYSRTGERLPTTALGEGLINTDDFNSKVTALNEKYPVNIAPLSDDDIDRMALTRMAKAKRGGDELSRREKTWGGTFGSVLGTLGGGIADPIAAMTLPLGGAGELGVLGRMIEFGLISGGTEATTAAVSGAERERAVPGSAAEIPGEVAFATGAGALLGGAHGLLERWLKTAARPLPTSVRDDVNAGTSEAQINASNVFPTAEGEIAGRDAAVTAVGQAARGEPVTAGNGFDPAAVRAFADSVGATTDEQMAAAGDRALRPLTHDVVPDVEHFDPMPSAEDQAADYWEQRLSEASPEERAALGATDQRTAPAASTEAEAASDLPRVTAPDLTPRQVAELSAEPATGDAVLRDLDRYRLANPDAEFSTAVRRPDGTFELTTRKLEDVMDELDGMETTGKELLACATGLMAAE